MVLGRLNHDSKPQPRSHRLPCLGVTEGEILDAIKTKEIGSVKDVIRYTQAGDGCTACHPLLREYLQNARRK